MRRTQTLGLLWLLSLAACAPDITDTGFFQRHPDGSEPSDRVALGTAELAGQTITLSAAGPLTEGWNTILAEPALASLSLHPVWTDGDRTVRSPFSAPVAVETDEGLTFDVLFLAPSVGSGQWELALSVDGAGSASGVLPGSAPAIPVVVGPGWQVIHLADPAYTLTWYAPRQPKTGNDRLELVLHHFDGAGFESVSNASLALDPYMDMGGGEGHSTPYTNPVDAGGGWYTASINFIMSGEWDVTVHVSAPGQPTESIQFADFNVR